MIPLLEKRPDLRCSARARRTNWQRCRRVRAYGQSVCQSHGAVKNKRFGEKNANYKHGNRSQAVIKKHRETRAFLRWADGFFALHDAYLEALFREIPAEAWVGGLSLEFKELLKNYEEEKINDQNKTQEMVEDPEQTAGVQS